MADTKTESSQTGNEKIELSLAEVEYLIKSLMSGKQSNITSLDLLRKLDHVRSMWKRRIQQTKLKKPQAPQVPTKK